MRKIFRRREKQPSSAALPASAIQPWGIKVLHCPEPCDVDIVFVHGLSGDREKTWTGPGQTEPWPKAILPDRLPTARILVFGYDAKWLKDSSSQNRVKEHASNLLAALGQLRDEDNTSNRPLIFVCHSLGGLVCMDALVLSEQQGGQRHLRKIYERTIGIEFLGTPHQGSGLASGARMLSRLLLAVRQTNSDITNVLHRDSEELSRIQDSFHLMIQRRSHVGLPVIDITYFFEELPLSRALGVIVPRESATRAGCLSMGIHANHSNMTKFKDANDDGFLKVTGELRRWIEAAKQIAIHGAAPTSDASRDKGKQGIKNFTVPYSSNQNFIGRTDIIEELKSGLDFTDVDRTWQSRVALYGLGGIGKTQIAIQFTYWLRSSYPDVAVYWMHASNADRFRQSFTSIAQECGIPGLEDPKNDVLSLVKAWLGRKEHGQWLMVVDNADDEDLFTTHQQTSLSFPKGGRNLGSFIPDCAHGNILITTRNKKAGSRLTKGNQLIEIDKMDPSECETLFRRQVQDSSASTDSIARLSEKLEFIPLALAQAAAFIRENASSVDFYLKLLDEKMDDLLNEEFEAVGRDEESLHAVAATWEISYQQIQQRNPLAGELLSLMTFFDRQEIPRAFLLNYHERQNNGKNGTFEVAKAIGHLLSFCLIREETRDNFNIHRLVQLTTRKWLTNLGQEDIFQREALLTVLEMFPDGENVKNRATCTAYLAHAQVSRHSSSLLTDRDLARAELLTAIGGFFWFEGRWKEAEEVNREAETIRRGALGEEHPNTLESMSNLALTFLNQGRLEEAEKLELRVLELRKRVLGEEHPDTLTSMNNLALTFWDQGRLEEAEKLQLRVLELDKRVLGEEHPDTLTSMNNLALTFWHQERLEEAEKLDLRILGLRKKVLGEEHPNTLASMNNLAATFWNQGRLEEAEKLELKVLELRKRVLGEEHPDTLSSINNLASTFWDQGRLEEAEKLQLMVLELYKRVLSEEHPDTLLSMNNLAHTWRNLGREDDARETMSKCIELRKLILGDNHPYTQASITALQSWVITPAGGTEADQEVCL